MYAEELEDGPNVKYCELYKYKDCVSSYIYKFSVILYFQSMLGTLYTANWIQKGYKTLFQQKVTFDYMVVRTVKIVWS